MNDIGEVRRLSAGALANLSDTINDTSLRDQATTALIKILDDPYKPDNVQISVMGMAAFALGEFRSKRAVSALITALESDSGDLRLMSTRALQKIADPVCVPSLIVCLDDTYSPNWTSERVCDAAALGLEAIATPEALGALTQWRDQSP